MLSKAYMTSITEIILSLRHESQRQENKDSFVRRHHRDRHQLGFARLQASMEHQQATFHRLGALRRLGV